MSPSAPFPGVAVIVLLAAAPAFPQDPAGYYEENCAPCHTIGGGEQGGPDLKSVTARHERQWLIRFMLDPEAMVASRDPRALDMVKHWDGAVMPRVPDLTPLLAESLLQYVEQKSAGGAPVPAGAAAVFTPADVTRGRAFFDGTTPLAHGGPACIACHAAAHEGGALGGGRLGLDLTLVSARLRGPQGIARWLESPPTPMMRALARRAPLTPDENRALTAFLDDARNGRGASAVQQRARLAGIGLAGAMAGMLVFGAVWRNRFRGVREPLVARAVASVRPGADS